MPAGVTWGAYIKFSLAAMLSMFAGAQVVHTFYNPLRDIDKLVEEEVERMRKELVEQMEMGKINAGTSDRQ